MWQFVVSVFFLRAGEGIAGYCSEEATFHRPKISPIAGWIFTFIPNKISTPNQFFEMFCRLETNLYLTL